MRAVHSGFGIGFVPAAVVRYTIRDYPGALMRQRFNYGRGLQRLLVKSAQAGWIDTSPRRRWKDLAIASAPLVWTAPRALRGEEERLQYLAHAAHAAGEATELLVVSVHRQGLTV